MFDEQLFVICNKILFDVLVPISAHLLNTGLTGYQSTAQPVTDGRWASGVYIQKGCMVALMCLRLLTSPDPGALMQRGGSDRSEIHLTSELQLRIWCCDERQSALITGFLFSKSKLG